jgi:hypothetical protein
LPGPVVAPSISSDSHFASLVGSYNPNVVLIGAAPWNPGPPPPPPPSRDPGDVVRVNGHRYGRE